MTELKVGAEFQDSIQSNHVEIVINLKINIQWGFLKMPEYYTITGRIIDKDGQSVSDYIVQAFDKDPGIYFHPDDRLGRSITDNEGAFKIIFTEDAFEDWFEGNPEIYLVIRDEEGRIIKTTETKKTPTRSVDFQIRLKTSKPHQPEPDLHNISGEICSIKQPMYCPSTRLDEMFEIRDNIFPKESLINSDNMDIVEGDNWSFDANTLIIWNNRYWKGFLSTDPDLFNKILIYAAGFYKRFWRDGNSVKGETHPYDSIVYAANECIETEYPGFGKVLLLEYRDPPNNIFHDLMKIVDEDTIIGKAFGVRKPPRGEPILNFSLSKKYYIDFMTHDDFKIIFSEKTTKPEIDDIMGIWEGKLISDSIHSPVLFKFRFQKENGHLKCKYIFGGIIPSTSKVKFTEEMMEMLDFAGQLHHNEIRMIRKDIMVGKYCTMESLIFNLLKRAPGFIMKDDSRICLPYILHRVV
jgi:hypothetical protein